MNHSATQTNPRETPSNVRSLNVSGQPYQNQFQFSPQPFIYPMPMQMAMPAPISYYPPNYYQQFPPSFQNAVNPTTNQNMNDRNGNQYNTVEDVSSTKSPEKLDSIPSTIGDWEPEVKDLYLDLVKEITLEHLIDSIEEVSQKNKIQKLIFKSYHSIMKDHCLEILPSMIMKCTEELNNEFIRHKNRDFYEIFGAGEGNDQEYERNEQDPKDYVSLEKASIILFCFDSMVRKMVKELIVESMSELNEEYLFYTKIGIDGFGCEVDEDNDFNTKVESLETLEKEVDKVRRLMDDENEEEYVKSIIKKLEKERKIIRGFPKMKKLTDLHLIGKVQWSGFGSSGRSYIQEFVGEDDGDILKHEIFFQNIQINGFGE